MTGLAAYGWVALPWWTWPLIFTVVMAGVYAGMLLDRLHDRREHKAHPCEHLIETSDVNGVGVWCRRPHGHTGSHEWLLLDFEDLHDGAV